MVWMWVEREMTLRAMVVGMLVVWAMGARGQSRSVSEQYLFSAANAERVQRGLPELRWDDALFRAAERHAQEMASRRGISHQFAGEAALGMRVKAAGAKFSVVAENVAEASSAVVIHDLWMNSPGHRANLLDPQVNAVGISVVRRDGQLYAVQDFEKTVVAMSFAEQEEAVGQLVYAAGAQDVQAGTEDARRTCAMETGFAGARQPTFVMRFTAGDLAKIPDALRAKIASGRFSQVAVGACEVKKKQDFSSYSIAVMLYP